MATGASWGSDAVAAVLGSGGDVADRPHVGVPVDPQVGPDGAPARPGVVGSPSAAASGLACTPAAQITVRVGSTSPEAKRTWSVVTSSTVSSRRTSTWRARSVSSAARCDEAWNGPSSASRASTSTTRARPTPSVG